MRGHSGQPFILSPVRGDSTFVHLIARASVNGAGPCLCGSSAPEGAKGRVRWRRVTPSEKTCNACFAIASANRDAEIEWSTK